MVYARALQHKVAKYRIVVGHRKLFAVTEKRLGDYAIFERLRLSEQYHMVPQVIAVLGDEPSSQITLSAEYLTSAPPIAAIRSS